MNYNFYFKDLRNIKQNIIKIDHHIQNMCRYISVNKVQKGLKIKVKPHTGINTNDFHRRWNIIVFECSTRSLNILFRRCLIPKERSRTNIFGFAQNQ